MSSRPISPSGTEPAPLCGVLLAAGSGRRFGSHKLLAPLADGRPLAVAAASNMVAALTRVVAVVRWGDEALAAQLRGSGAEVIFCPDAARGMGHSLACAVAACQQAGGWVVALADMPAIRPDTIAAVAKMVASGAAIAAPCYRQQRGHPVAFATQWRKDLLALRGDQGARRIIERQRSRLVMVECDDPGVVLDIDLPADLDRYLAAQQKNNLNDEQGR